VKWFNKCILVSRGVAEEFDASGAPSPMFSRTKVVIRLSASFSSKQDYLMVKLRPHDPLGSYLRSGYRKLESFIDA